MSYYFPSVDPIYLLKRRGTESDPFLDLVDENFIRNDSMILKEVPSFKKKVEVVGVNGDVYKEVTKPSPGTKEFRVDYSTGVLHFHASQNGKKVVARYLGMGYVNIPSTRIVVPNSEDDPMHSLQDVLDNVQEGLDTLEMVGDLDFKGEYSPTFQYKKWNFITFSNKTFVAMSNISGNSPLETDDWKLVSSGVGFVGVYDPQKKYTIGDMVADKNNKNIYFSKIVDNQSPLEDEEAWELMVTLDDYIEAVDEQLKKIEGVSDELELSDKERDKNEGERQQRFSDLVDEFDSLNDLIMADENTRDEKESQRQVAETGRNDAEQLRREAEDVRAINEEQRISSELARQQVMETLTEHIESTLEETNGRVTEELEEMISIRDTISQQLVSLEELQEMVEVETMNMSEFQHKGEFIEDAPYTKNNIVEFEGSSYIAINDTDGEPVENDSFWQLLARRGSSGIDLTIEGARPDEDGDFNLSDVDIVRTQDFEELSDDIYDVVGDKSELLTVNRSNLVSAINELKTRLDTVIDNLPHN